MDFAFGRGFIGDTPVYAALVREWEQVRPVRVEPTPFIVRPYVLRILAVRSGPVTEVTR